MEIRIKTLDEVQGEHVTIEVYGNGTLDGRLYTATEVGNLQASEAELVAAPLRRRVTELEGKLELVNGRLASAKLAAGAERERANQLSERVTELKAEMDEAQVQHRVEMDTLYDRIRELTTELETERSRADSNRAWAERTEVRVTEAERNLTDAERAVQILSGQLGRISGAVHGPVIQAAMNPIYRAPETTALRSAVSKVRSALGSPSLPASPDSSTSQA